MYPELPPEHKIETTQKQKEKEQCQERLTILPPVIGAVKF